MAIPTTAKVRITAKTKIRGRDLQLKLFNIYQACFEKARHCAAQDQLCYDPTSFKDALKDPDYVKFVLNLANKPIGLALATTNLAKASITYMNPRFFRKWLGSHLQGKKILYFTFLGILPSHQRRIWFFNLVTELICFCEKNQFHAGLDFSNLTSDLPQMLQKVVNILLKGGRIKNGFSYRKLGYQEYGVFEINPSARN